MSRHEARMIGAALVMVGVFGCVRPSTPAATAQSSVLTHDEIARADALTALEAIQLLRPGFLVARGATSLLDPTAGYPNVYVDGIRHGALATLADIRAADVATIRLYRSGEATYRFGTGNPGGVIAVTTRH